MKKFFTKITGGVLLISSMIFLIGAVTEWNPEIMCELAKKIGAVCTFFIISFFIISFLGLYLILEDLIK